MPRLFKGGSKTTNTTSKLSLIGTENAIKIKHPQKWGLDHSELQSKLKLGNPSSDLIFALFLKAVKTLLKRV